MNIRENIERTLTHFSKGKLKNDYWKGRWDVKGVRGSDEFIGGESFKLRNDIRRKKETNNVIYFEGSHWLSHREYDEDMGILVIYFDPIETNGKAPVVIGLEGKPVERSFVRAFDAGIHSYYYGYGESVGAFYKKYIAQYEWINFQGEKVKAENPHKIVEAIEIDELEKYHRQLKNLSNSEPGVSELKSIIQKVFDDFKKNLSKENFSEYVKNYSEKKLKKFVQKKVGKGVTWVSNKSGFTRVKGDVIKQLETNRAFNLLKDANGRSKVYDMIIREKGLSGLARQSNFRNANRYYARKNIRKFGVKRTRLGGVVSKSIGTRAELLGDTAILDASLAAAPETAGLSMLIGLGVSVTKSMVKRQDTITKYGGQDAMGVVDIILMKKYTTSVLKRMVVKELSQNGMSGLVKSIGGVKQQPAELNKAFGKALQGWAPPDIKMRRPK